MEEDPQAPGVKGIAEEEEMAPPELRRERHREDDRDLGLREVVDVVVLADDEALPLALRAAVDAAVDLEDHRSALERDVGVRVGDLDEGGGAVEADMQELAAVGAEREIRDDVEVLACLPERLLEDVVEVGRDDQLIRAAARSEQARQLGQRPVDRPGGALAVEQGV